MKEKQKLHWLLLVLAGWVLYALGLSISVVAGYTDIGMGIKSALIHQIMFAFPFVVFILPILIVTLFVINRFDLNKVNRSAVVLVVPSLILLGKVGRIKNA